MPNSIIENSLEETIQSNKTANQWNNPVSLMMLLSKANDIIAPYWSRKRDIDIRSFIKGSDHLAGAVYNMTAKMTAIPIKVEARDKSIKTHVALANQFTDILIAGSQFGDGWAEFYSRLVEDLISQDNGAFAEVIGPGPKDGPLTGAPISLAHLDASRCTRTGNPLYPVIYDDINGKRYKLHYSRVIMMAQMPSTDARMLGVGFCSASRAINATQNLIDIAIYKQEKLGSRPARQLLITGGGLDPEDIQLAVGMSEREMNNRGLSRFAKTIVAGNRSIPTPKIENIQLTSFDGFDEKESTILAMSVIAMAFGMDAKELFPAVEGGTKADAIVQHMKQRGKGPGQIIEATEKQLDSKFLPPFLKATFDYQDDAQDRQAAEIRSTRSQSRQRDLLTNVTNTRIERQLMVENGEISQAQFVELELEDGRLEDGLNVTVLFSSDDADYKSMLGGVTDATCDKKIDEISNLLLKSKDVNFISKSRKALAAINEKFIKPRLEQKKVENELAMRGPTGRTNMPTGDAVGASAKKPAKPNDGTPDTSYQGGEKFGRKLGKDEAVIRGDQQATNPGG